MAVAKWIKKEGLKYRQEADFLISKDESHVIFNDIKYEWKKYYYLTDCYAKSLHRAVWEHYVGPIPKGYHVHHKDRNRRNNHIENLQLLDGHVHLSRSAKTSSWVGSKENLDVLAEAREKGKKWHSSKAGKKWHSNHAKVIKFGRIRPSHPCECEVCGTEFNSHRFEGRFCSRKCKSKSRYHSGVDNENRTCIICGKFFDVNRHMPSKTCSRACGGKSHSILNAKKRLEIQPKLKKIGQILKEARLSKNITQAELSRKSGIGRDSIYLFESGKRAIKESTAKQLAKALRIDYTVLLVNLNSKISG